MNNRRMVNFMNGVNSYLTSLTERVEDTERMQNNVRGFESVLETPGAVTDEARPGVLGAYQTENAKFTAHLDEISDLVASQRTLVEDIDTYLTMIDAEIEEYEHEYEKLRDEARANGTKTVAGTPEAREIVTNHRRAKELRAASELIKEYRANVGSMSDTWTRERSLESLQSLIETTKAMRAKMEEASLEHSQIKVKVEDTDQDTKKVEVVYDGRKARVEIPNQEYNGDTVNKVVNSTAAAVARERVQDVPVVVLLPNGERMTVSSSKDIGKAVRQRLAEIEAEAATKKEEAPVAEPVKEADEEKKEAPVQVETPVQPVVETTERVLDEEATMLNYRNSGYGQNAYGWYFDVSKDDYVEGYSPLNDPLYQVFKEVSKNAEPTEKTTTQVLDEEATMLNYRNSGYGQNVFGWFYNPNKDEFQKDYNPLNDPLFQVFKDASLTAPVAPVAGSDEEVETHEEPVEEPVLETEEKKEETPVEETETPEVEAEEEETPEAHEEEVPEVDPEEVDETPAGDEEEEIAEPEMPVGAVDTEDVPEVDPEEVEEEEEKEAPEAEKEEEKKEEKGLRVVSARKWKYAEAVPYAAAAVGAVGFGLAGSTGLAVMSAAAGIGYGALNLVSKANPFKKWALTHKIKKVVKGYDDLEFEITPEGPKIFDISGSETTPEDIAELNADLAKACKDEKATWDDLAGIYARKEIEVPEPRKGLFNFSFGDLWRNFKDYMTRSLGEDEEEVVEEETPAIEAPAAEPVQAEEEEVAQAEDTGLMTPEDKALIARIYEETHTKEGRNFSDASLDQIIELVTKNEVPEGAMENALDITVAGVLSSLGRDPMDLGANEGFTNADVEYIHSVLGDSLLYEDIAEYLNSNGLIVSDEKDLRGGSRL